MNTFTSFDGIQIAYHDEGAASAVILLHGGYVDGLGQFGDFERILPLLEKRQEMFRWPDLQVADLRPSLRRRGICL